MNYDIVTRLRQLAEFKTPLMVEKDLSLENPILSEAADEIERLRTDRDYYRKIVDEVDKTIQRAVRGE